MIEEVEEELTPVFCMGNCGKVAGWVPRSKTRSEPMQCSSCKLLPPEPGHSAFTRRMEEQQALASSSPPGYCEGCGGLDACSCLTCNECNRAYGQAGWERVNMTCPYCGSDRGYRRPGEGTSGSTEGAEDVEIEDVSPFEPFEPDELNDIF